MVWVVVGPHEVTDQAVLACQVEPGFVFLEGREAVRLEVFAG
jgi:hypothetical protein